jgi:hypothetical protein
MTTLFDLIERADAQAETVERHEANQWETFLLLQDQRAEAERTRDYERVRQLAQRIAQWQPLRGVQWRHNMSAAYNVERYGSSVQLSEAQTAIEAAWRTAYPDASWRSYESAFAANFLALVHDRRYAAADRADIESAVWRRQLAACAHLLFDARGWPNCNLTCRDDG